MLDGQGNDTATISQFSKDTVAVDVVVVVNIVVNQDNVLDVFEVSAARQAGEDGVLLKEDVKLGSSREGEGGKRLEELFSFFSNGLVRSQDAKALIGVVGCSQADRMLFHIARKVERVRRHLYNRVFVVCGEHATVDQVADLSIMFINARHARYAQMILRREVKEAKFLAIVVVEGFSWLKHLAACVQSYKHIRCGEDVMVVKKLEDVKLKAEFTCTTTCRAIRMSSLNDDYTQYSHRSPTEITLNNKSSCIDTETKSLAQDL